jgi:hypothetical protein
MIIEGELILGTFLELVLCGHSLGAGVAAILGMVSFVCFLTL